MSDEQGFRGIPGVPDGWELVRIGRPDKDEYYLDGNNEVNQAEYCIYVYRPIVRKIEKQKQYRQFKNGEEFKPFRDRWWRMKSESVDCCHPPAFYSDNNDWGRAFDLLVFDDGTPFGVEVTE